MPLNISRRQCCVRKAAYLHELVVQGRFRGGACSVEELVQALPLPVVHAVGAHYVQLLHRQVLLHGPQGLYLAPHANEQQLLHLQRTHS